MAHGAKHVYGKRHAAAEREFARWEQRHSRLAMAAAILALGVVVAFVPVAKSGGSLPALLAFAAALAGCGVLLLHARRHANRAMRVVDLYRAGLDRMSGKRTQTGQTGEAFADPGHLYARDLDVTGPDSLFGMLATTRTALGHRELARFLLHGVDAKRVRLRQDAVRELTPAFDLREGIALLGSSAFEDLSADRFDVWLRTQADPVPGWLRPALVVLTVAWLTVLASGLLLHADEAVLLRNVLALLAVQGALCLRYRASVQAELNGAERLAAHAAILRHGLRHLREGAFSSEYVRELQGVVASDDRTLARLQRLLVLVEQRAKEWYYAPALLLAAGTHAAAGLQKWKREHERSLAESLRAWGEFDALLALSAYAVEHPNHVYPGMLEDEPASAVFAAEALRHPLLRSDEAVPNDIALGGDTRFLLISGSNMAGKSTLLRSIGANAVLALAGLPVPAKSLRMHAVHLGASLALSDSLAERKSKFLAEVQRLRDIVSLAGKHRGRTLFLVDEIFSGTNSLDRKVAAEAVLASLVGAGAIGALSTHDLTLTALADQQGMHGQNMHMASAKEDDPLAFDYTLKEGINRTTNALAIVKMLGL